MLQRPQPTVDFPTTDAPGQSGPGELVDFVLGFLLRQYLVILLLVLLGGWLLWEQGPRTFAVSQVPEPGTLPQAQDRLWGARQIQASDDEHGRDRAEHD